MTTAAPLDLTNERAEELIRLMTDGLVNIEDKTGEFLLHRELRGEGKCQANPC